MTRNERVAEVMGWENRNIFYFIDGNAIREKDSSLLTVEKFHPEINIVHAKLLQARMIADGWEIQMTISWQGFFLTAFSTCVDIKDVYRGHDCQNESAAIVALFCKVFSIEGEG